MKDIERENYLKNKEISRAEKFLLDFNPNKEQYYFMKNKVFKKELNIKFNFKTAINYLIKARNLITKTMFQHFHIIVSELTSELFNDKQLIKQLEIIMNQQSLSMKDTINLCSDLTNQKHLNPILLTKNHQLKLWGVAKKKKIFDFNLMEDEFKLHDKISSIFPNNIVELDEYYLK